MKFLKSLVLTLILFLCFHTNMYAEEDINYTIFDYSDTSCPELYSTHDYYDAYSFYVNNLNNYQNLCLYENDKAIYMEYGVLYISENEEPVIYYSLIDETEKELINYKEYELLYISESLNEVKFVVGGDVGLIYKEEVEYYPYNSHTISFYDCQNNSLTHHIASSTNNYYKYNLQIDLFPDYLNPNIKYYSYDGHYFYDDFYKLSDDFYLNTYENSINYDNPYYNYYAYLPSRSYSNYSYEDFSKFIANELGIKGRINYYIDFDKDGANDVINRSEYYGNLKAFVSSESIYGVNALSSLAWSSEESSFGKSKNAYVKSNLFNHYALTGSEIENNKYSSIKSSIFSHAENYVSRKYCNMFSPLYVGSHIGDYMSGIASVYSKDPHFSDKVISKAFFYDSGLGFKDRNYYSIAILNKTFTLYYDKELSKYYNSISGLRNYSLVILEEYDDGYKVQCDYSMNESGEYNPEKCIAYIKKMAVDRVLKGNANSIEYNSYEVDVSEDINKKLIINLYNTKDIDVINEFVYKDADGYDLQYFILQDNIYIAQYKKIKEISAKNFEYPVINNNGLILNKGKISVFYDDNTSSTKNMCGDYISSFTHNNKETNIIISYNNVKSSVTVEGINQLTPGSDLNSFVDYNKYAYSNYTFADVEKNDATYDISSNADISSYIKENEYDLNVSGIYPSFIYHSSDILSNIINTYYFDINKKNADSSINQIASKYGLEYCDGFDINISRCFYNINLISPVIMQVKLPHANNNAVYTVYHKESNGDIIKLPTQFSDNYIKFMTTDDGKYYVYSANTASQYSIEDRKLLVNIDNNGVDFYKVAKEGIQLFVASASGYLLFAIYVIIKRKENRNWRDYKRLLQQAESVLEEKQNN